MRNTLVRPGQAPAAVRAAMALAAGVKLTNGQTEAAGKPGDSATAVKTQIGQPSANGRNRPPGRHRNGHHNGHRRRPPQPRMRYNEVERPSGPEPWSDVLDRLYAYYTGGELKRRKHRRTPEEEAELEALIAEQREEEAADRRRDLGFTSCGLYMPRVGTETGSLPDGMHLGFRFLIDGDRRPNPDLNDFPEHDRLIVQSDFDWTGDGFHLVAAA